MFSPKHLTSVAVGAAVTAMTFGSFTPEAQALSFGFQFDTTPNGTVTPPIVGTGTFSFDGDPGVGDFALTSLPNYQFALDVGGSTFGNADIATPLANVLVRIADSGGTRSLNFGGSTGGPFGGSLDFVNGSTALSFQPNFGALYFSGSNFGTYEAIEAATPTPIPTPALLPGLVGMGVAVLRKKKQEVAAEA